MMMEGRALNLKCHWADSRGRMMGKWSTTGRMSKCYTALLRRDLSPSLVRLVNK